MKVDAGKLLRHCGIDCTKVEFVEAKGKVAFQPARMAFVTHENVHAISGKPDGKRRSLEKVRYGDALIVWTDDAGTRRGTRVEAGRDAGVQISARIRDEEQLIPFTGLAMLSAREKLASVEPSQVTEDQRRALAGIQGVMHVIMSHPDPIRFPQAVIGNAFAAAMLDAMGRPRLPVPAEDFGRKARADLIRAKISRIDPDHPDGLGPLRPLHRILDDFGIGSPVIGGRRRPFDSTINEASLRRLVSTSPELSRGVFGTLTTTPVDRLSAAPMTSDDYEVLTDGLSSHRITGAWLDGAVERVTAVMREANPVYRCDMAAYAIDNRDIFTLRDNHGPVPGMAYAYSWPSMERLPSARINGAIQVNISPEEIPDEEEIRRLQGVLDLLSFGAQSDVDLEIDGISVQARGPKRQ